MIRRTCMLVALAVLSATALAEAANNTLATAYQGVLGEERSQDFAGGGVRYAGRSYAAFCWKPFYESGGTLSGSCAIDIRDSNDTVVSTAVHSVLLSEPTARH